LILIVLSKCKSIWNGDFITQLDSEFLHYKSHFPTLTFRQASTTGHNINSNLVIETTGPLGDTHIVVHISKSLKEDKFPDDYRYSV
jgi:hypothetical protein